MIPELKTFDWILVNTSSGKDSQTTLRYVAQHCKEAGVESGRLVAVHADLGRIEWPGCKELAGKQAEHYGMRLEVTKRTGCDLLDYVRNHGKWPSSKARFCTSDFKRGPILRIITQLTHELNEKRPARILNCMGMRAQESPARAKKLPYQLNKRATNGTREVWDWLSIHAWPLEEVWSDIRKSGVPHHEAYDAGMPRLSCSFCIFAPPAGLMLAGKLRPDLLEEYVKVEKETGHKFKVNLALVDIQKALLAGEEPAAVLDWKM